MSNPKPIQVYEGEWMPWGAKEKLQCCGCGMTHSIERRMRKGRLELRFFVDNRATAQVRRHAGIKVTTKKRRRSAKAKT